MIRRCILVVCLLLAAGRGYTAVLRVATLNIEQGLGPPGSDDYEALKTVLARVDADVVALQELTSATFVNVDLLAAEMAYAYTAISGHGPFAGGLYNGFLSRFPITAQHDISSPPDANELTRYPFFVAIDVPATTNDPVLVSMHCKGWHDPSDDFRRAIEALRAVEYLEEQGTNAAFAVVLGDFNDDSRDVQPIEFAALPDGLPSTYELGFDVLFPVAYATFPTDRFAGAGFVTADARQLDGSPVTRPLSARRLDYILATGNLLGHGPYAFEVYNSDLDVAGSGLPKTGDPLPPGTSADASDHLLVFGDIWLEPCPYPVIVDLDRTPSNLTVRFEHVTDLAATYFLDRTTSLTVSEWQPVATDPLQTGTNGLYEFVLPADSGPAAYWRVRALID